MQSEYEYLSARLVQERQAARDATHAMVRLKHLESAEAYEARLRDLDPQERRAPMHIVGPGSFSALADAIANDYPVSAGV